MVRASSILSMILVVSQVQIVSLVSLVQLDSVVLMVSLVQCIIQPFVLVLSVLWYIRLSMIVGVRKWYLLIIRLSKNYFSERVKDCQIAGCLRNEGEGWQSTSCCAKLVTFSQDIG